MGSVYQQSLIRVFHSHGILCHQRVYYAGGKMSERPPLWKIAREHQSVLCSHVLIEKRILQFFWVKKCFLFENVKHSNADLATGLVCMEFHLQLSTNCCRTGNSISLRGILICIIIILIIIINNIYHQNNESKPRAKIYYFYYKGN